MSFKRNFIRALARLFLFAVTVKNANDPIHQRNDSIGRKKLEKYIGMPWLRAQTATQHHFEASCPILDLCDKTKIMHIRKSRIRITH